MSDTVDAYLAHMGVEVDDEIKHYGVPGMKWGKRKAASSNTGSSSGPSSNSAPRAQERGAARAARKAAREKNNQEINEARLRQREREVELERQAFKTYAANGEKAIAAATRKYERMEANLLENPDAATAAKLTTGEKWATGVNLALGAASVVGYVGYMAALKKAGA